jgi:MSHA biogenesis protein MshP
MKPFHSSPRRERGVGIVTAIFLLVVMAGLAAAMVSLYTSQQASSNVDLAGARAYQAARAGAEWGMFKRATCDARAALAMPAGTTLSGFTVIVSCSKTGLDNQSLVLVRISAVACNYPDSQGGCNCDGASGTCTPSSNPETVNRKVEVQL